MNNLASNEYAKELRRALFYQDTVHQFESKAHFDNCDFHGTTTYIDSLLNEADRHVQVAQAAKAKKDTPAMVSAASKAFLAIGQALHAVQDFYAHTDYIERTKNSVKDESVAVLQEQLSPIFATIYKENGVYLEALRRNICTRVNGETRMAQCR